MWCLWYGAPVAYKSRYLACLYVRTFMYISQFQHFVKRIVVAAIDRVRCWGVNKPVRCSLFIVRSRARCTLVVTLVLLTNSCLLPFWILGLTHLYPNDYRTDSLLVVLKCEIVCNDSTLSSNVLDKNAPLYVCVVFVVVLPADTTYTVYRRFSA